MQSNQHLIFAVSDDEWNTKEDTGKSVKNALCILHGLCQKAPLGVKQR